jgi:tetratricopeptide (TPR) repeat protein
VADAPAGDGAALNDQGYAMLNDGDAAGAVPVLQRAVDSLQGSGDELTYNYALFNLAHALRLAGRPDEAIPLLEQRLKYPDQTDAVQAELAAARQAAGGDGE